MISGILLAAGESSRMEGAFKPLLAWGSGTVIDACVKSLRDSRLGQIIVVLGHREAEIRSRLAGSGVEFAINPDYKLGMLSSVKTALSQIGPQTTAVLIALVDQPMVTAEIINQLIDAYEKGDKRVGLPTYEGRHGHPIILSRDFEEEIMRLEDLSPDGLRTLINGHRDEILEVPANSAAVIDDIDRPEDYERLSKQVEPIYASRKWHP